MSGRRRPTVSEVRMRRLLRRAEREMAARARRNGRKEALVWVPMVWDEDCWRSRVRGKSYAVGRGVR